MKIIDSLVNIQDQVSEETFQEIMQVVEDQIINERGDLLDDISKTLTGKTLGQHAQHYIQKGVKHIGNVVKDKILKSNIIKNSIGRNEYDKAYKDLDDIETKYNQARQNYKNSVSPSSKRIYKADANYYNREANKRAKKVSDIKQKYGLK